MTPAPNMSQHTRRYWMIDGLPELMMGGAFLVFSALQVLFRVLPPTLAGYAQILVPVLIVILLIAARPALQALKARTTYPHTGYVEYQQPSWRTQLLWGVVSFVGFGALFAWLTSVPLPMVWLPALTGALTALTMASLGQHLGLPRFYALAGFSLLVGIGVALLPIDGQLGFALVQGLTGLWLLVSGSLVFVTYRRTVRSQEDGRELPGR